MKNKNIIALLVCLLAFSLLFACSKPTEPTSSQNSIEDQVQQQMKDAPVIYTSINSVYEFTKTIAGSKYNVLRFVPTYNDIHSYEPTAADMQKIQNAKAFFYDGLGLEPYIPNLKANAPNLTFYQVAPTDDLIAGPDEDEPTDPHIWLSPKRARAEMENIKNVLSEIDPDNAAYFQKQFDAYAPKCDELDATYRNLSGKTFVVTHNAFSYLAKDYGITFKGVDNDAHAEPSPAQIKEVVDYCKANNIKVIYRELNEDDSLAKVIADEAGLEIRVLNAYEDPTQMPTDYYEVMMLNYKALSE